MEYNIYYRSDFEVIEKLMDADGNPMDLYNTDIELAYQTDGMTTMKACCKNGVCCNCYIDENDHSILHVLFDNHKLGVGRLAREVTVNIINPHFEDDTESVRFKEYADTIVLVSFGGTLDNKIVIDATGTGIVGFDHSMATNRDLPYQHPISAITGLEEALENVTGSLLLTDYVYSYKNEGNATFVGRNNAGASVEEETWRIKVIWYVNNVLQVFRFENVAWSERYNLLLN